MKFFEWDDTDKMLSDFIATYFTVSQDQAA